MENGLTTKRAKEIRQQVSERLKNPHHIKIPEGQTNLDLFCIFSHRMNTLGATPDQLNILLDNKKYQKVSLAEWICLIESFN